MVVVGKFRNQAELRKKLRRPMHHAARILINERGTTLPCEISDASETGARLVLKGNVQLPERFVLLLTPMGQSRRICRLVWRNGNMLGVAFQNTTGNKILGQSGVGNLI
jgi:hypothetical protein